MRGSQIGLFIPLIPLDYKTWMLRCVWPGKCAPSQPWRSPATARAGCPPPSPSAAAGWSRWCHGQQSGCAWCSCRWRSLQPGTHGVAMFTWTQIVRMKTNQIKNASCKHFQVEDSDPIWTLQKEISLQKRGLAYVDHCSEWHQCKYPYGSSLRLSPLCMCALSEQCISTFAAANCFSVSRKHSVKKHDTFPLKKTNKHNTLKDTAPEGRKIKCEKLK